MSFDTYKENDESKDKGNAPQADNPTPNPYGFPQAPQPQQAPGPYGYSAPQGQPTPSPYTGGVPQQAPSPYGYGAPQAAPQGQQTPYGYGVPQQAPQGQPAPYGYGAPQHAPQGQPTPGPYGYAAPQQQGQMPPQSPYASNDGLPQSPYSFNALYQQSPEAPAKGVTVFGLGWAKNIIPNPATGGFPPASPKSSVVAYVLWFFLGWLGVHQFYLGNQKRGLFNLTLYFFTAVLSFTGIPFSLAWVAYWIYEAVVLNDQTNEVNQGFIRKSIL